MQKKTKTRQIYYVGFYSEDSQGETKRYSVPAAVNKIHYIARVIAQLGYSIKIVSPSWIVSKSKKVKYFSGKKAYNNDICIEYLPSFTPTNKIMSSLSSYLSLFLLLLFLIKNTNKNSIVILYHSTFFFFPVFLAKRIISFKLIIEVEEIYHLFTKSNKTIENRLLSLADSYILSNKTTKNYLIKNCDREKPFIIINGEYSYKNVPKIKKPDNAFIKVIFSGNIESVRKGAFNAVSCAKYLSNNYKLYILGFGNNQEIKKLIAEIKKVNAISGYDKCVYPGVMSGDDYDQFLFNCDIAINPQEADESYMQFAFPSKVISYLSHNLRTVSTKLESIVNSDFADLVTFVSEPTPESFAKAIESIDTNLRFNAIERIKKADLAFKHDLDQLIFNLIS